MAPSPARCALSGPPPPPRRWPWGPSPRSRPGAPPGLATGSTERASAEAGAGGRSSRPSSERERAPGGGEAAGGRALLPPAPRALSPASATDPLPPTSGAESRGPSSPSWPCAPLIALEAASGAPECALDKYLPSAHGVPGAGPGTAGLRKEESEQALPSRDLQSGREGGPERDPGIPAVVEEAQGLGRNQGRLPGRGDPWAHPVPLPPGFVRSGPAGPAVPPQTSPRGIASVPQVSRTQRLGAPRAAQAGGGE
nr:basic proline-rich protein-like [Dasypus novemcinctus]